MKLSKRGLWVTMPLRRKGLSHDALDERFAANLGREGRANRLRQSPPYVGFAAD
jgi:hypothetical protein